MGVLLKKKKNDITYSTIMMIVWNGKPWITILTGKEHNDNSDNTKFKKKQKTTYL